MEEFKKCKSYTEMAKWLGYNYYNGRIKKEIEQYCLENNLNAETIIANNSKKPNICLQCGKEITGKDRFVKKFCNSSCAASYNNKGRKRTNKSKRTVKKSNLVRKSKLKQQQTRKCIVCGKDFYSTLTKSNKVSRANTCSDKCRHDLISRNSKATMLKLISEGRHSGWKSRNIISYPENFWMNVLKNNNINYKHNYPFGKYFLDFYIEIGNRKIDLEIDGKQHLYEDRKQSDIIRNEYVMSQGLEVYRIEWNTINTKIGKLKMKEKINLFLQFIKD